MKEGVLTIRKHQLKNLWAGSKAREGIASLRPGLQRPSYGYETIKRKKEWFSLGFNAQRKVLNCKDDARNSQRDSFQLVMGRYKICNIDLEWQV